jgi:pentose-5-phosphate-3-epimerase
MTCFSVSAVCLGAQDKSARVRYLLNFPVEDLHCDIFPMRTADTALTISEVSQLMTVWPRRLTVHLWSSRPAYDLSGLRPRSGDRVLIQDIRMTDAELDDQLLLLASRGWLVGMSMTAGVDRVRWQLLTEGRLSALQVLSTSTPGRPGGRFTDEARQLVRLLAERRKRWSAPAQIELDGGITKAVVSELRASCDLFVLGSNSLLLKAESQLYVPDIDPGQGAAGLTRATAV